jgi:hypothetical protein
VVMKSNIFCDITQCSPLKANRRFGDVASIFRVEELTLVSYLPYSSTLKMEATYSSETLGDFQQTRRRYIPEDITLQLQLFNNGNRTTGSTCSVTRISGKSNKL